MPSTVLSLFIALAFCSVFPETLADCGTWTDFTDCSVPCGGGSQSRSRSCREDGMAVPEDGVLTYDTDRQPCNTDICPQECTEWSGWSPCSRTCGVGSYKMRVRYCLTYENCCRCEPSVEVQDQYSECPRINCDIDCEGPDCKWSIDNSIGNQYDPLTCEGYYTCVRLPPGDRYQVFWNKCPDGTVWNVDGRRCDHNITPGTPCERDLSTPQGLLTTTTTPKPPTTKPPCHLRKQGKRKYYVKGQKGTYFKCPKGTEYSPKACGCQAIDTDVLGEENDIIHDCECMRFGFEGTPNGDGCNKPTATVPSGELTYGEGVVGEAAFFDGKTRVSVEMFKQWLEGSPEGFLTITVWVKLPCDDEGYDHQGIVTNTDCTSNSTVDLHMYNGVIAGGVITAHSNGQMITFQLNHTIPCGEWTHLTMRYGEGFLKLYINCEVVESIPLTGRVLSTPIALFMGHSGKLDDQFFTGYMDELEICRRALPEGTIQARCDVK